MKNNITQKIDSLGIALIELKALINVQHAAMREDANEYIDGLTVYEELLCKKADKILDIFSQIELEIHNFEMYSERLLESKS